MRQAIVKPLQGDSGSVCINFDGDSSIPKICNLKEAICLRTGISNADLRIVTEGGRSLDDTDPVFSEGSPSSDSVQVFSLLSSLLGGKGGFGSMLRAQGGRMSSQKTTNFEACRDLSGHRFKTLNLAKKIAAKKVKEAEIKKGNRENLEKRIQKYMNSSSTNKVRVDDSKFLDEHDKVLKTLERSLKKTPVSGSSRDFGSSSRRSEIPVAAPSSCSLAPGMSGWHNDIEDVIL